MPRRIIGRFDPLTSFSRRSALKVLLVVGLATRKNHAVASEDREYCVTFKSVRRHLVDRGDRNQAGFMSAPLVSVNQRLGGGTIGADGARVAMRPIDVSWLCRSLRMNAADHRYAKHLRVGYPPQTTSSKAVVWRFSRAFPAAANRCGTRTSAGDIGEQRRRRVGRFSSPVGAAAKYQPSTDLDDAA